MYNDQLFSSRYRNQQQPRVDPSLSRISDSRAIRTAQEAANLLLRTGSRHEIRDLTDLYVTEFRVVPEMARAMALLTQTVLRAALDFACDPQPPVVVDESDTRTTDTEQAESTNTIPDMPQPNKPQTRTITPLVQLTHDIEDMDRITAAATPASMFPNFMDLSQPIPDDTFDLVSEEQNEFINQQQFTVVIPDKNAGNFKQTLELTTILPETHLPTGRMYGGRRRSHEAIKRRMEKRRQHQPYKQFRPA